MGFLKTYRGKIVLAAFIGIQIPILGLIYYFWLSTIFFTQAVGLTISFQILPTLLVAVLADLLGTAITLYALYHLLVPLNCDVEESNYNSSESLEEIIHHLTHYDVLTGLPNRQLFQSHVLKAIAQTKDHQQFALIVLDLNSLKNINSTLGRQVGDLLLTKVAQRLNSRLKEEDILARFGGDEFVVLRTNITNKDGSIQGLSSSLIALANSLLESLSEPFSLYGKDVYCDAKIGITIYPFDGITVEQLLQNADTAIYQAKQKQLSTYQFYSPASSNKLKRALAIKNNLRFALEKQEFFLYYQPRIEISTGRLVGVEALLRWYNPELGAISPNEFIPIAEETNCIVSIGEWVLYNACLQNKQWQQAGLNPLRVSVNLSTCQFKQENLVATIDRILHDTGLDMDYLELEITESILVEDIDRAISILWELKHKGISIALDDFGTGYSSLSYLQKLPLDTLKIDRSFVANIASNPDDLAISKAIIALAQSLELNITAEGVETQAQLDYLYNQGCNEVQGYFFAKPLASNLIRDYLVSYEDSKNQKDIFLN